MMQDLLRMIAIELVDRPEEVSVSQKEVDGKIVLELKVAPEDMGKVIGKQGRIAKSIRTIIKTFLTASSLFSILKFVACIIKLFQTVKFGKQPGASIKTPILALTSESI